MKILALIALFVGFTSQAALNKTFTTPQGVTANYWKVSQVVIMKNKMTLGCQLDLYIDQDHADALNAKSLFHKNFAFRVISSDLSGDMVAKCYNKILSKQDPDLIGATSI